MIQKRLKDLTCYMSRGVTPLYSDSGVCILNQKCIRNNKVSFDKAQYTDENRKYPRDKYIQKGDILVNSTGTGTLGRVAIYEEDFPALCDSHITIIRLKQKTDDGLRISPRYVDYYLHLNETIIESFGKGATNQIELSAKDIGIINIFLPNENKQNSVIDVLDAYSSLIDVNNKRIRTLEDMAENLFKEWFVRFRFPGYKNIEKENGVPKDWEYTTVEELSQILQRGISPDYDDEGDFVVVSQKCIRQSIMNIHESRRQTKGFRQELNLKDGDTVICSTGTGTLGRVGQVYGDFPGTTFDSHVTLVRAKSEIGKHFLFWTLKSLQYWFMNMGIGSTNQQELYKKTIANTKVLLPNATIISKFERIVEPIHQNIIQLLHSQDNLIKQRQMLLPRLLNGKLEV